MEQNVDKNIYPKDRVISFFKKNKNKLIILVGIVILLAIYLIVSDIYKKKETNSISEKYIQVGLLLSSNENEKSKILLEEIILSKNKFYSILALNILLENNLENDKNKILNYFQIVEKSNKLKSYKDLIVFKKALYLIKNSEIEKGEKILNDLIDSDSSLKLIAAEILSK